MKGFWMERCGFRFPVEGVGLLRLDKLLFTIGRMWGSE